MLASQLVQEDKQEHAGRSSGRLQSLLDALSGLLPNSVQNIIPQRDPRPERNAGSFLRFRPQTILGAPQTLDEPSRKRGMRFLVASDMAHQIVMEFRPPVGCYMHQPLDEAAKHQGNHFLTSKAERRCTAMHLGTAGYRHCRLHKLGHTARQDWQRKRFLHRVALSYLPHEHLDGLKVGTAFRHRLHV